MKIFIDAGHGGSSVGASYKGRLERDDTLRLAKAVKKKLEKTGNIEVMLSREGNTNPAITARCAAANVWGADYFLSIHRNAFAPEKASGVEAWVKSSVSEKGNTYAYAKKLTQALVKLGFADRGVKKGAPAYADFGVNRLTEMHSCLLEAGFIDNSRDNKLWDENFDKMASAIARALCEIVDVPYETERKEEKTAEDKKVTAADARKVLRAAIGLEDPAGVREFDIDRDGKITVADARAVLRKAIGIDE